MFAALRLHRDKLMDDYVFENGKRTWHCTCCKFTNAEPGKKCLCADDFCDECKRCVLHCYCYASTENGEEFRNDGSGVFEDYPSTSSVLDQVVAKINNYFCDEVEKPLAKPELTEYDKNLLAGMLISWDGDNRENAPSCFSL
jgi:hypothetical protein